MRTRHIAAIILLSAMPALAHRLDEYLQATLISIAKDQVQVEITLTPGVAVFPVVAAEIDTDGDGAISAAEQRAYAGRVLGDLSLSVDGRAVRPTLVSLQFPSLEQMKEGLGGMRIELKADLPRGGHSRELAFENRHQSRIGAYLVNCLVPRDPGIQIVAQRRNDSQSVYRLEYLQASAGPEPGIAGWPDERVWLAAIAIVLAGRFTVLWRQRCRVAGAAACDQP